MWEWLALGGMQLANTGISFYNNSQQIRAQKRANAQNIALQREFAQNGINWRKQDAIRAGINPIYALGANGASFTPSVQAESGAGIEGFNPSQFIALKQAKQAEKEGKEQIKLMQSEREKNKALKALYEAQTGDILNPKSTGADDKLANPENLLKKKDDAINDRQKSEHFFTMSKMGKERYWIGASDQTALGQKASEPSILGIETKYYTQKVVIPEILKTKAENEARTGTIWDYKIHYGLAGGEIWNTGKKLPTKKSLKEIQAEIQEMLKYDDNRLYD